MTLHTFVNVEPSNNFGGQNAGKKQIRNYFQYFFLLVFIVIWLSGMTLIALGTKDLQQNSDDSGQELKSSNFGNFEQGYLEMSDPPPPPAPLENIRHIIQII
jgi:hypothetical protein